MSSYEAETGLLWKRAGPSCFLSSGGMHEAISSRALAAVSRFPSRGSRDLWLSLQAFPGGFSTMLSHRAVPRATVV